MSPKLSLQRNTTNKKTSSKSNTRANKMQELFFLKDVYLLSPPGQIVMRNWGTAAPWEMDTELGGNSRALSAFKQRHQPSLRLSEPGEGALPGRKPRGSSGEPGGPGTMDSGGHRVGPTWSSAPKSLQLEQQQEKPIATGTAEEGDSANRTITESLRLGKISEIISKSSRLPTASITQWP